MFTSKIINMLSSKLYEKIKVIVKILYKIFILKNIINLEKETRFNHFTRMSSYSVFSFCFVFGNIEIPRILWS